MVKQVRVDLDKVFAALSHPVRRAMVARLAGDACTVGELAEAHAISGPAISKHLRVLEAAGLLVQTPEGRVRRCELQPQPLGSAFGWLVQYQLFWSDALDALANHLERAPARGPPPKRRAARTKRK